MHSALIGFEGYTNLLLVFCVAVSVKGRVTDAGNETSIIYTTTTANITNAYTIVLTAATVALGEVVVKGV